MDASPLGLAAKIAMSVKKGRKTWFSTDPPEDVYSPDQDPGQAGSRRLAGLEEEEPSYQRMTPEDMQQVSSEAQEGRHAPAGVPTRRYEYPLGTTYLDHYGNPVPDDGTFEELNGEARRGGSDRDPYVEY